MSSAQTIGPVVDWRVGSADVRESIEAWVDGVYPHPVRTIAEGSRRHVLRIERPRGPDLLVKHYRCNTPGQRVREAAKRWLGRAPADREWAALEALRALDVPCPEPLGLARLADGSRLLVQSHISGHRLDEALQGARPDVRRSMLAAVGRLLARLHAAGAVHRDLHVGNLLIDDAGEAHLVDLQRVRRSRSGRAKLADLGDLDFSLAWLGVSRSDRLRVLRAALDLECLRDATSRSIVRAVGVASKGKAAAYFSNRTRRCLRAGSPYARVSTSEGNGLRLESFSEASLIAGVAAHRRLAGSGGPPCTEHIGRAVPSSGDMVLKRDHRAIITAVDAGEHRFVVKEVKKGGVRRRIADVFRGSPARRAWVGGHGLRIRGIRAATPLAFLERRRFGVPIASLFLYEDLRRATPASELNFTEDPGAAPFAPTELSTALIEMVAKLHRRNVAHGDLQALHIYLERTAAGIDTILIDFEGVRFPQALSDDQRLRDLAVLNASLGDSIADCPTRRSAFLRYARQLPFRRPRSEPDAALARIAELSRARNAAWRGSPCDVSRPRP